MRSASPRLIAIFLAGFLLIGCNSKSDPASPAVARGEELSRERGCVSCHSTDGSESVGPTWKGLAGSKVELADGSIVTTDDAYLEESIKQPSAKTVKGFQEGLMETVIKPGALTDDEVAALIAYIESLR